MKRPKTGPGIHRPSEEGLLELKIDSMRMADQRDIIALGSGKVNTGKAARHLRSAPEERIKEHLGRLLSFLENKARGSLKGVFVLPDSVLEDILNRARKWFLASVPWFLPWVWFRRFGSLVPLWFRSDRGNYLEC